MNLLASAALLAAEDIGWPMLVFVVAFWFTVYLLIGTLVAYVSVKFLFSGMDSDERVALILGWPLFVTFFGLASIFVVAAFPLYLLCCVLEKICRRW